MNNYDSLRKKNKVHSTLWILVAVLLVFELCSVSVLFSQVVAYTSRDSRLKISLTEGSSQSALEVTTKEDAQIPTQSVAADKADGTYTAPVVRGTIPAVNPLPNSDKTGFGVHDEDKVWNTVTDVEIFHLRYDDNGDGHFTVESSDTDKVFAPGTTESYPFTLFNSGKYNLKYTLTVDAWYEGTEVDGETLYIPIDGRFIDYNNEYLVGSAEEWPDVLELDQIYLERYLSPGSTADYTLQWRWAFERGDQITEGLYRGDYTEDFYDTMLGNLAVDQDLELHIVIRAWVEIDETQTPDDTPKTGDQSRMLLWMSLAAAALVLLAVLLFFILREKKKEKNEAAG